MGRLRILGFVISRFRRDGRWPGQIAEHVSMDINPRSRQILENLINYGYLEKLVHAGARIHQLMDALVWDRRLVPEKLKINENMFLSPPVHKKDIPLEKGPNIKPLPSFDSLPKDLEGTVLIKIGANISTDEIMPAGSKI